MKHEIDDPLAVIASEVPAFPADAATALVRQHYGLAVTARALVSERDQNFLLQAADGRRFVLKIANAAEDPAFTDFQIRALLHMEERCASLALPLRTPRILRTVDGETRIVASRAGARHVVRIVTWLDGTPLAEAPASAKLCRDMGAYLANLGIALEGFEHPGADQRLLWDIKHASALRKLFGYLPDQAAREIANRCLDNFERFALPAFGALRTQVIHSDLNPDNVLLDPSDPESVAGVIDFGDMTRSPLIADVAIGASYLRELERAPLDKIVPFVAGYRAVTPLEPEELDVLPHLIRVRALATVSIASWRAAMRPPDDPYLVTHAGAFAAARRFLERLAEMPAERIRQEIGA